MRRRRQIKQGARYHISAKINRGDSALNPSHIKDLFVQVLMQAKRKYAFKLIQYCIMNNHIHMIIQPLQNESLSNVMRWVFSVFAMRYNKITCQFGHVWNDRFFSRILQKGRDFLNTFRYILQNPVKAQLVPTARSWLYTLRTELFTELRIKTFRHIIYHKIIW